MNRLAIALLAATFVSASAFAAGDAPKAADAPKAGGAMMKKAKMMKCGKGMHAMAGKGGKMSCMKMKTGMAPDKDLYAAGYQLAMDGDFEKAITILSLVQDHNNPDVLNMLGYSNRKSGRIELGISYYAAALAQKPDFVKAREYLGEGYVAAGKLDLAKGQLAEIQKVCGTTCNEYQTLSKVIDSAVL